MIRRACALFDRVIVGVLYNPNKQGALTIEKRTALLEKITAGMKNVEIAAFPDMLLVEAVKKCGADVVLRGIRGQADAESELQMARVNRQLSGVETLFIAELTCVPMPTMASSGMPNISANFGRRYIALKALPNTVMIRVPTAMPTSADFLPGFAW